MMPGTVVPVQDSEGSAMARQKGSREPARLPAKARAGPASPEALLEDLRSLIRQTREGVAQAVNSALVLLYWQVGHRIRTEILKAERAAYGEQILSTLSKELTAEFGRGFSWPNLSRMMRLAEAFPDAQIVAALSRQFAKNVPILSLWPSAARRGKPGQARRTSMIFG